MLSATKNAAVWFSRDGKASLFYPFGIGGVGYVVSEERAPRIAHWTYWRAQLPLILWTIGFVPLIDLWAPSMTASRRLDAPSGAFAFAVLTLIAAVGARMGNRLAYVRLLRGCPVTHVFPSRAERRTGTQQFGASARNIIYLPLPVAFLGLLTCATTMYLGAVREDIPMWAIGALVSPLFWYAFIKEGVDEALRRIRQRL